MPVAGVRPCDSADCRLPLNDARGEIERLRRQLAGLEATRSLQHVLQCQRTPDASANFGSSLDRPSWQVPERRSYAVPPIGEVQLSAPIGHDPPRLHSLRNVTIVTNLGTMMDVLI